jgi:hypothetical protein
LRDDGHEQKNARHHARQSQAKGDGKFREPAGRRKLRQDQRSDADPTSFVEMQDHGVTYNHRGDQSHARLCEEIDESRAPKRAGAKIGVA